MSDLLTDLLENPPKGITVKSMGLNDKGEQVLHWWACDRFGISLRLGAGYGWAEGMELIKDGTSIGWDVVGKPRDLEGRAQVIEFLREVIAEYRVNVQF